jgi:hypothetical protein
MRRLLYLLLICCGLHAKAQQTYSITGVVTDLKGTTIPGAVVFLTNTQLNAISNNDGAFTLTGLKPGTYELVVKMLGFDPYIKSITIQNKAVNVPVELTESNTTLKEIVITGKRDPSRARYLKTFIKKFIGETDNASKCKILNPEVIKLHYDKENDILTASSDRFITIENKALGYKLSYLLIHFEYNNVTQVLSYEGKPYFEELEDTEGLLAIWMRNRKKAYEGSTLHFLRALYNNTSKKDGFLVYQIPNLDYNKAQLLGMKPVDPNLLLVNMNNGLKLLRPNVEKAGRMYVVYTREEEPSAFYYSDAHIDFLKLGERRNQTSQISFYADYITLDNNGTPTPANGLLFAGYLGWERVADLMPLDYSQGHN